MSMLAVNVMYRFLPLYGLPREVEFYFTIYSFSFPGATKGYGLEAAATVQRTDSCGRRFCQRDLEAEFTTR